MQSETINCQLHHDSGLILSMVYESTVSCTFRYGTKASAVFSCPAWRLGRALTIVATLITNADAQDCDLWAHDNKAALFHGLSYSGRSYLVPVDHGSASIAVDLPDLERVYSWLKKADERANCLRQLKTSSPDRPSFGLSTICVKLRRSGRRYKH